HTKTLRPADFSPNRLEIVALEFSICRSSQEVVNFAERASLLRWRPHDGKRRSVVLDRAHVPGSPTGIPVEHGFAGRLVVRGELLEFRLRIKIRAVLRRPVAYGSLGTVGRQIEISGQPGFPFRLRGRPCLRIGDS